MLALGRDIAMFRPTVDAVVRGDPDAILVVEFAEETEAQNAATFRELEALIGDLALPGKIRSDDRAASWR